MSRSALRLHPGLDTGPNGMAIHELPLPATSASVYGNDHPLCVEVGSGKGSFLIEQAKAFPEHNYLGIERTLSYWRFAADRLRRHGLTNALMIHGDAAELVRDVLSNDSVSEFHIYFPDPWPKTRHQRRRLVQLPFIERIAKRLTHGGRLQIVTDHADYFEQIVDAVRRSSLLEGEFIKPASASEKEMTGTNFERKYARQGRPFHSIAAKKPG